MIGQGQTENEWYYADDGAISVSFGATAVTITNTSGATIPAPTAPWDRCLLLDMLEHLDTDLPMQTQYAAPSIVPKARPATGSNRLTATTGLVAQTDLLGMTRAGYLDLDTLEPVSGTAVGGAIEETA